MYDSRSPLQPPRRKTEYAETRSHRVLGLLLLGFDGAVLSNVTQVDADFRARTATSQARSALSHGVTAYDVLLEFIAPLFEAPPGVRVKFEQEGD